MIYTTTYHSPCGQFRLGAYEGRLCLCDWLYRIHPERILKRLSTGLGEEFLQGSSDVLRQAAAQLDEYFDGKRKAFSVPLLLVGTDFQKAVWQELQNIPYGAAITYAEEARRIGRPEAVRAVANANGANALSIFVPCHRVIGANGMLGGYAGGADAKRWLLEMEGNKAFR